ncbi:MAG TPA: hypothetical protein EYP23_02675, partial [Thermoplasmata archaeon]|nr:hypothetical protein [Thermoplasmata archaeon]
RFFQRKGLYDQEMLIVGTDSHTTIYGAFGAFSPDIGATGMAGVWATGKLWLSVPETFKIVINGTLPAYVTAEDIILHIIGKLVRMVQTTRR